MKDDNKNISKESSYECTLNAVTNGELSLRAMRDEGCKHVD